MQGSNSNSFPYSSGSDLASQNVLMQGLGMNPQGNAQGQMGGYMQNQQSIGYPMFDQSNFNAQGNMAMGQFNPMMMQQNMGNQLQGYGMPQNPMSFQMQQQLMNGGNPGMMSMADQMTPYGAMNPQALLAQTLQGAQMQGGYGSADAMMALQGMMGSKGQNYNGDTMNNYGGNNTRFNSNNTQNNDNSLRLNTVYVSELPSKVDHDMIKDNFSKVGPIKLNSKSGMPMIWIFKDRGVPKGDALVTYDSNSSAQNAVSFFKENDFDGKTIDVRIATNAERPILAPPTNSNEEGGNRSDGFNNWAKNDWSNNRQRGDFRNNSTRNTGTGDKSRGPDWMCAKCNNNNFSWRESCNRCQEPKSDDAVEVESKGDRNFGGGNRSNNRMVHRNTSNRSQDGGPMRGPRKNTSRPGPY